MSREIKFRVWKFHSADWLEEPSKYPMVENHPFNLAMAVAVIKTPEGEMTVSDGDYIIKGVHGDFYPCKPDIFKETYEPLGDGTPWEDLKRCEDE